MIVESHSDSEKTFAIIIGLLAGVALIIIFATFMRRVFGGNGKTIFIFFLFFSIAFFQVQHFLSEVRTDKFLVFFSFYR